MPPLPRSRTRKHLAGLLIASASSALVLGVATGGAPTARADPGSVASKQAEAQHVLAQVQQLDSSLNRAAEAYDGANLKLAQIKRALVENGKEIKVARRTLRSSQRTLAARLVAIYTSGDDNSTLEVLLGASSLEDAINRIDTANRVAEQDRRIVKQVSGAKAEVERRRHALEQARRTQTQVVADRAAQRTTIAQQLAQRRQLLASVRVEVTRLQAVERQRQLAVARQVRARLAAQPPQQPPAATGASAPPPGVSTPPPGRYSGVVAIAMRYLGVPYKWGGASPQTGFDCSGFTMYVFAQIGVSLPHYTGSQYQMGTPVSRSQLEPGDLVFFDGLGHEGIYIGNNQFIHAPHTGDVVKISSITGWYAQMWVGARRL